jgi:DNA polymerase-4
MALIHFDLDAFFATAEVVRNPRLAGLPLAIAGTSPRSVVATASYEARAFGVHSGLSVHHARTLCPRLVLVPPDFAWYKTLSYEVLAQAIALCDIIEPLSLDEAYMGFATEHSYDDLVERATSLRATVRASLGLTLSVGIAPTRASSKLASDAAKPDGLVTVTPDQLTAFLFAQPLANFPGIGPATRDILEAHAITTPRELSLVDLDLLVRLLGAAHARHLQALVTGNDSNLVTPPTTQTSIGTERTLEVDVAPTQLVPAYDVIFAEAIARLHAHGMAASTITLKARTAAFRDLTRTAHLPSATNDPAALHVIYRQALTVLTAQLHEPVRLVGATFSGLATSSQLYLDFTAQPGALPSLARTPTPGSRVRHATFGPGTVAVSDVDVAIVRFDTPKRVRIIHDPRQHLVLIASTAPTVPRSNPSRQF